ncbi:MAG: branched-chain amino acid ABC transporter permease [Lautropia sp.]
MELLVANGIVNGIIVGAIYALIGLSLTLLYGVLRVVNFAHGEFVIAGCFFSYVLFEQLGLPPLVAVPLAALGFFAAGWALYYLLLPRLARSDDAESMSFLLMYGVSIFLSAGMLMVFEADSRSLSFTFSPISVALGPVYVSTARLVALAITVVIVGAMGWYLYRTMPGKAIRAAIMNRDAIQIVGVDVHRLSAFVFALAIALAGVTGVLTAMVFPAFSPFSGAEFTTIGFIVIVLGGLGNPVGALLAGVLYGVTEQLASVFVQQALAPIAGFLILIATIFLRPAGLLGRKAG